MAACTCLLFVLQPGVAKAGTATFRLGPRRGPLYSAAQGEANDLTITQANGRYTLTDTVGVTAGAGCKQVNATTASCPRSTSYDEIFIHTRDGNDTVHLAVFQPTLVDAGPGNDALYGGPEPDTLVGGTGTDILSGGAGQDVASYGDRTDPVNLSLDGVANDGAPGENDFIMTDVERLAGGSGNDTITGSAGADFLIGGGGVNTISGLGGSDFISGLGADTVHSGGGDDTVYDQGEISAGNGDDYVNAGPGGHVNGGPGNDSLGSHGMVVLNGGSGDDQLNSSNEGSPDTDICGTGSDVAIVDAQDTVASDCETVQGP
jgi:Ca2+-binding RTX toxin-like protein